LQKRPIIFRSLLVVATTQLVLDLDDHLMQISALAAWVRRCCTRFQMTNVFYLIVAKFPSGIDSSRTVVQYDASNCVPIF